MKKSHIRYAILGPGALLVIFFLFIKTQAIDLDRHNRLLQHINHFKRVDAVLNQHILEIRQGLLPYYDPATDKMAELGQLRTIIAEMLHQLCPDSPGPLEQRMEQVDRTLAQKQELLEAFKSSNALLHNSLNYLPLAATRLTALLPSTGPDENLRPALDTLLRDILIYNLGSEPELVPRLNSAGEALQQRVAGLDTRLRRDIDNLLAHVRIVLDNRNRVDTLTRQLLDQPTAQRMDEVLAAYSADHARMLQDVNTYRQVLVAFSILLLATVGYVLFRLNRTTARLRHTVADLNYQKSAMDEHAIVSITDRTGRITYANEKFCEISKRSKDELIGKNHRIVRSGYHAPEFYRDLWRTISSGRAWHGQIQNRARDGSHYWVDTTIVPFMDDNGTPYQYVAIRTDITEIKQAEEQLRVQAAALEAAGNGIVITDPAGNIQWVNTAFTTLTGYSRDELVGQTTRLFKSGRQPASFYRDMWQTILAGQVWHGELVNRRKDGSLYMEEQTISPVFDEQSEIIRFISIKKDITERKHVEEVLRRSQKMEAIGQLSGGVAHDFNNQLGIIIGYLDFLKQYTAGNDEARKWVDTATQATLRCMNLTRQLLAFSSRQPREETVVNLNTVLRELETMIARSVTPAVEVGYSLADDIWQTEIDPGEFHDAILNLVINARDAMPDGGKLQIETANRQLDSDYAAANPGIEAGDYVRLKLSDTGSGMDRDTLEHIFEPFFTTKPEGKGTGLGMAMVYGFVKRYGGHIKIHSEPGAGSTVLMYLPRSRASNALIPVSNDQAGRLPGGRESILIVDDEADLLALAGEYLGELGYRTRSAGDAARALAILAGDEHFDLLFSDVVMPGGMNGYELAQKATQLRPGLKVLLTSGFTSKTFAQNTLSRFSERLLSKPYRKADLAQRVRQVLDEDAVNDDLAGRTILVVDDEADMRDLFRLNLERLGCKSLLARNGDEALGLYRQSLASGRPVDVVILDLSIPEGMDGREIAQEIHALDPHARIIVSSGYTESPEMTRYREHGFSGALEKNFDREKIRQVLARVLSANAP